MRDVTRRKAGTVRQLPNGRWLARISRGVNVDGTRRELSATHDTREQAEDWILKTTVAMGERPDFGARCMLRDLWRVYKLDRAGKLANSTLTRYEGCMERWWLPALGGSDMSMLQVQEVQRVLDRVPGRTDARQCKAALSSVLTWAVRNGILSTNPIRYAAFAYPGDEGSDWEQGVDFDADPFGAIESGRDVWSAQTVLEAMQLMRGLPLEPVWLAMVGAGLRLEEAFALRRADVRRISIGGSEVTQLAVHHATNAQDGRHRTKSRKSVRIATMLEPFGLRLWSIAERMADSTAPICQASAQNYGTRWRGYFAEPPKSKHAKRSNVYRGRLHSLPYIPLSKMRNTHETLMQEAGVLDSINAAMHGHSERISYRHYQMADSAAAARQASEYLQLVV